jgi:hypothetical protein
MTASIKAREQIERYLSGGLSLSDLENWVWQTMGELDPDDRSLNAEMIRDISGPLAELEAAVESGQDVEGWFREELRSIATVRTA